MGTQAQKAQRRGWHSWRTGHLTPGSSKAAPQNFLEIATWLSESVGRVSAARGTTAEADDDSPCLEQKLLFTTQNSTKINLHGQSGSARQGGEFLPETGISRS